ncbi:MAG: hypothetical protein ACK4PI_04630 [Tepidisphaerales bacterium]
MKLRRFNQQGMKQFVELIERGRAEGLSSVPFEWLEAPPLTEPLRPAIEAERPTGFDSKLQYVEWLDGAARRSGTTVPKEDDGFWAWLTLWLFDLLCPPNAAGVRKLKETIRYIPNVKSLAYKRHSLTGPYFVYDSYRDRLETAQILLSGKFDELDRLYRLTYENDVVGIPCVLDVLTELYFDRQAKSLKRNFGSEQPGNVRRLFKFFDRLMWTYDLDSLTKEGVLAMLPREFDRWKKGTPAPSHLKTATA